MAITWKDGTRLWVGKKNGKVNIGIMLDENKGQPLLRLLVALLNLVKSEKGTGEIKGYTL